MVKIKLFAFASDLSQERDNIFSWPWICWFGVSCHAVGDSGVLWTLCTTRESGKLCWPSSCRDQSLNKDSDASGMLNMQRLSMKFSKAEVHPFFGECCPPVLRLKSQPVQVFTQKKVHKIKQLWFYRVSLVLDREHIWEEQWETTPTSQERESERAIFLHLCDQRMPLHAFTYIPTFYTSCLWVLLPVLLFSRARASMVLKIEDKKVRHTFMV